MGLNNNQQEDFMDGCINTLRNHEEFLRIQVEIKDLSSRLMSPSPRVISSKNRLTFQFCPFNNHP
jgi:hypothetical protein